MRFACLPSGNRCSRRIGRRLPALFSAGFPTDECSSTGIRHHLLAAQMKKDARAPQPEQDCCVRSGILWDLAAVYPPGSIWSERMPAATVFNGPVVDVTDAIEDAVAPGPKTPARTRRRLHPPSRVRRDWCS